jgi:uncharacterized hydrophobic protein (TIGR00271 family)
LRKLKEAFWQIIVSMTRQARKLTSGWAPYIEGPVSAGDLDLQMRSNAIPSLGFFLMLGLSAIIATLGLIADSAPAIIGAMIIAPLMAPIVSVAYGIACMDRQQITLSITTIIAGTFVVIAIAYVGVETVGFRIAGPEILSRTSPSFLDLGVALAAGCAGAFAQTRPSIASSIAGVAIAVALVPPLAVTGIGLSLGRKATTETGLSLGEFGLYAGGADIASGAFLLFLTNLIGIVLVATLVFIAQRYGNWRKALAAIAAITVASFLLIPPLNQTLHEIYVKNRVVRLHVKRSGWLTDGAAQKNLIKIEKINVDYRDDVLHVIVDMFATRESLRNAQQRVNEFQSILSAELGEPVVIELEIIPIDLIRIRSAPSNSDKNSE